METVSDFLFLGSKITADGDCSHEIKKHFLLGRKVMTKLNSILKSRVASRLLHLYSTDDKTSRLKMKSFSTLRDTQRGSLSYMEKRRGRG